jgi:hypothetical protein
VHLNKIKVKLVPILLLLACPVYGQLPKLAFGKYLGERDSYIIVQNDVEIEIEKHEIALIISEKDVTYLNGNLELKGNYESMKQPKGEYLIKAKITNGKSVNYEIEFTWNKKAKTVFFPGTNGEPDALLDLVEN